MKWRVRNKITKKFVSECCNFDKASKLLGSLNWREKKYEMVAIEEKKGDK